MASTHLSKTFSSAGNQKTWTYSVWLKRSKLSDFQAYFANYTASNYRGYFAFFGDNIYFYNQLNGVDVLEARSTSIYRDTSAWYHIVVKCDTTQATSSDRFKVYVNGTEVSLTFTTTPSQNADLPINDNGAHYISSEDGSGSHFDGVMAHVHFIDGTTYNASAFGQTDSTTGIWKPRVSPSVTYGTNGFFLKFANSGSMGTDSSGNGNNFSVAAGTLTQTQDTPSNVFCTLNPLKKHSGQTLSFLNLRSVGAGSAGFVDSTLAVTKGKWYFEFKVISANAYAVFIYPINLYKVGDDLFSGNNTLGFYSTTPSLYRNGSNTGSLGGGVTDNDIIQVAMDLDNNNIYFGKNGNWNDGLGGGFDQSDFSNATGHSLTRKDGYEDIGIGTLNGGSGSSYTLDWNFGNGYFGTTAVSSSNADGAGYGLFEYAPPTGYYSLCTKNINTYG